MRANQRKGFRILLKASLARMDTVLLFGVIPFMQQILLLWFRLTIRQSALYINDILTIKKRAIIFVFKGGRL